MYTNQTLVGKKSRIIEVNLNENTPITDYGGSTVSEFQYYPDITTHED